MKVNRYRMALEAICLLAWGCGSRSDLSAIADHSPNPEIPEVAQALGVEFNGLSQSECLENWEILLDDPGVSNGSIGVANGLLVFPWALWGSRQFEIRGFDLTAQQRGAFLVAPGVFSRQFWVNGMELLYVEGGEAFGVPLLGGESRSLLGPRPQSEPGTNISLTSTEGEIFWVQSDRPSQTTDRKWGVYRKRRSARLPELFGTIEAADFDPEQVVVTEEGLLVTGRDQTVIVPFSGGEQLWLAQLDNAGSAGVDIGGVYADRVRNPERGNSDRGNSDRGSGELPAYELLQAPTRGGAVQVLWQGPPGRRLENLYRYRGGWIAAGWDTFGNGRHAAIFWLSDSGQESYLGCGPAGSTIRSPIVVDNGRLYFSVGDPGGPGNRGQTRWLIRVRLTQ